MEKKNKKEEEITEEKQETKNNYTWLIIACIGGFCIFILLSFMAIRLFMLPLNIIKRGSNSPEDIIEGANSVIDKITEKIIEETDNLDEKDKEKAEKSIDKVIDKLTGEEKREKTDEYNESLEEYFGTNDGEDVKELIDEVVMKMKKEKEHVINVTYKETTTHDINELISLKKAFEDNSKYEVIMDYNEKGYIIKITITDY